MFTTRYCLFYNKIAVIFLDKALSSALKLLVWFISDGTRNYETIASVEYVVPEDGWVELAADFEVWCKFTWF